jgi:hypothetical protein
MSKHAHGSSVPVLELLGDGAIPLREVSGLALGRWDRGTFVVAVGDHGPDVAFAPLRSESDALTALADWHALDLSSLDSPEGSPRVDQAEAIALDAHDLAVVLTEDPPLLLAVDMAQRRVTRTYRLDGGPIADLAGPWAADASSRGEGLLLLQGGHVLVVKEKHPAGLVEFGPPGDEPAGVDARTLLPSGGAWSAPEVDRLVALAWWPGDDVLADYSDAEIGPDGHLYLLSDKSAAIGRVDLPLAVGPGARTRIAGTWGLPGRVRKAEGLTFLPDGRCVVASDRHGLGRNLAVLPPPGQWPAPATPTRA